MSWFFLLISSVYIQWKANDLNQHICSILIKYGNIIKENWNAFREEDNRF